MSPTYIHNNHLCTSHAIQRDVTSVLRRHDWNAPRGCYSSRDTTTCECVQRVIGGQWTTITVFNEANNIVMHQCLQQRYYLLIKNMRLSTGAIWKSLDSQSSARQWRYFYIILKDRFDNKTRQEWSPDCLMQLLVWMTQSVWHSRAGRSGCLHKNNNMECMFWRDRWTFYTIDGALGGLGLGLGS